MIIKLSINWILVLLSLCRVLVNPVTNGSIIHVINATKYVYDDFPYNPASSQVTVTKLSYIFHYSSKITGPFVNYCTFVM